MIIKITILENNILFFPTFPILRTEKYFGDFGVVKGLFPRNILSFFRTHVFVYVLIYSSFVYISRPTERRNGHHIVQRYLENFHIYYVHPSPAAERGKGKKVKISLLQAMEAHRVARS
jgi:hypothetical protein